MCEVNVQQEVCLQVREMMMGMKRKRPHGDGAGGGDGGGDDDDGEGFFEEAPRGASNAKSASRSNNPQTPRAGDSNRPDPGARNGWGTGPGTPGPSGRHAASAPLQEPAALPWQQQQQAADGSWWETLQHGRPEGPEPGVHKGWGPRAEEPATTQPRPQRQAADGSWRGALRNGRGAHPAEGPEPAADDGWAGAGPGLRGGSDRHPSPQEPAARPQQQPARGSWRESLQEGWGAHAEEPEAGAYGGNGWGAGPGKLGGSDRHAANPPSAQEPAAHTQRQAAKGSWRGWGAHSAEPEAGASNGWGAGPGRLGGSDRHAASPSPRERAAAQGSWREAPQDGWGAHPKEPEPGANNGWSTGPGKLDGSDRHAASPSPRELAAAQGSWQAPQDGWGAHPEEPEPGANNGWGSDRHAANPSSQEPAAHCQQQAADCRWLGGGAQTPRPHPPLLPDEAHGPAQSQGNAAAVGQRRAGLKAPAPLAPGRLTTGLEPAYMCNNGVPIPAKPRAASDAPVTFRSMSPWWLAEVRRIHEELFPISYSEKFYSAMMRGGLLAVVAVQDERVVGVATGRVDAAKGWPFWQAANSGYISTFGVEYAMRKRNVGSSLLGEIISRLYVAGCQTINLHVLTENMPAVRFYAKHGFRTVERLEAYYFVNGQFYDAYSMALPPPQHANKPATWLRYLYFYLPWLTSYFSLQADEEHNPKPHAIHDCEPAPE
ncbi:Histone acetyltransferase MCC1 [Diplonema papillatum]|nr:Histone acetyltransferase MCC1 [Diplonema papillatum]